MVVSPLHRALQTASYILNQHPNKANIAIQIDPYMREGLKWACSVPKKYEETKKDIE